MHHSGIKPVRGGGTVSRISGSEMEPSDKAGTKMLEGTRSPNMVNKDIPSKYLIPGDDKAAGNCCNLMDGVELLTWSSGRPMQMYA